MKHKKPINALETSFSNKYQSYAPFGSVATRSRKKKKGEENK